jgi:hypothetical protein
MGKEVGIPSRAMRLLRLEFKEQRALEDKCLLKL